MSTHHSDTRIETDSLGDIAVPASARWGAQTQRAVDNFPISGRQLPPRRHATCLSSRANSP